MYRLTNHCQCWQKFAVFTDEMPYFGSVEYLWMEPGSSVERYYIRKVIVHFDNKTFFLFGSNGGQDWGEWVVQDN